MRNIVVGSFVGFVLAAAFLAACGSSGPGDGGPVAATSGAVKWTPLGEEFLVATGIDLTTSDIWRGTTIYENQVPERLHRFAAMEITGNVVAPGATTVTVDVGIRPAIFESSFASDPQWIGSFEIEPGNGRRATVYGVTLPPIRSRFALRVRSAAGAEMRVTRLSLHPYDTLLP